MPTISQDTPHQTVITTYEVTPGTAQDLLDELGEAYEVFISKQPGFIGVAIHVNDAQTRVASYSQWQRREDFQAVLRTDEMRRRNRSINGLCKCFAPVMYDVVATID
ncbi:MAG: antibiotic biosynthesis monooxygenase [Paracoccaceae bacterium]